MSMQPRLIAVVPTLLTLCNAACGFGAITFAAKLGPTDVASNASVISALLVFLAMLFDALDGSAARLTRQTSELGAQLDSLCDAVSFGVAPSFLMLQFVTKELADVAALPFHPRLTWTIAALYTVSALLRLARFNVESDDEDTHDEFSGLPSPAAAGVVVAFPFAMPELRQWAADGGPLLQSCAGWLIPGVRSTLPLITLAAACLMVSRVRYPHFFNQLFRGRKTRRHVILLVFTAAVVYWVHELAVPLLFCWFAFSAPIRAGAAEWLASWKRPPSERIDVHRAG
jgi:CDP-diacylglycerol--serine O-phosphatidyltransferase